MNNPLEHFTTEELSAELARRNPPVPLKTPDFSDLYDLIVKCVNESIKNGFESKTLDNFIKEFALSAVYGPEYWVWRRSQRW